MASSTSNLFNLIGAKTETKHKDPWEFYYNNAKIEALEVSQEYAPVDLDAAYISERALICHANFLLELGRDEEARQTLDRIEDKKNVYNLSVGSSETDKSDSKIDEKEYHSKITLKSGINYYYAITYLYKRNYLKALEYLQKEARNNRLEDMIFEYLVAQQKGHPIVNFHIFQSLASSTLNHLTNEQNDYAALRRFIEQIAIYLILCNYQGKLGKPVDEDIQRQAFNSLIQNIKYLPSYLHAEVLEVLAQPIAHVLNVTVMQSAKLVIRQMINNVSSFSDALLYGVLALSSGVTNRTSALLTEIMNAPTLAASQVSAQSLICHDMKIKLNGLKEEERSYHLNRLKTSYPEVYVLFQPAQRLLNCPKPPIDNSELSGIEHHSFNNKQGL